MNTSADTSLNVWYCKRCRKSCKVIPPLRDPACSCKNAVPSLHPTRVTILPAGPQPRRLQALTAEEGRRRALARKGQWVRVTYEAEVVQAWTRTDADGNKHVQFMVKTTDYHQHLVNPMLPGVHIEAALKPEAEQ